jgi:hypothetical protein
MVTYKCEICGKPINTGDPCYFVKVKGQRRLRWYCEKCAKGDKKHGTAGKGH